MASGHDPSSDFAPSGVFTKLLLLVGIIGAATAVLAAVAAVRGGEAAATPDNDTLTQTATVTLTEFAIEGDLQFEPGPIRLEVVNEGAVIHNLTFDGGSAKPDLNGGDSAILDLGSLEAGTYTIFCGVPGHCEAGMEATLVVGSAETDNQTAEQPDWSELDRAMTESMLAFPAETEGVGNQPLQPTILDDGTKEFHLTTAITTGRSSRERSSKPGPKTAWSPDH